MSEINLDKLKEPVPLEGLQFFPGAIKKDGSEGLVLAYIDATFAADRLDDACGPENWDLSDAKPIFEGDRVVCVERTLRLRLNGGWVGRTDYGYPNDDKDSEPIKSMASDALKRCCWLWGIGRELRRGPNIWWPVQGEGKFKRFSPGAGAAYWKAATGEVVAGAPQRSPQPSPAKRSAPAGGEDGTPICPDHDKPMKQRANGHWYCATPVEKDDDDKVTKWCKYQPPKGPTPEEESLLKSEPPEQGDPNPGAVTVMDILRANGKESKGQQLAALGKACKELEIGLPRGSDPEAWLSTLDDATLAQFCDALGG